MWVHPWDVNCCPPGGEQTVDPLVQWDCVLEWSCRPPQLPNFTSCITVCVHNTAHFSHYKSTDLLCIHPEPAFSPPLYIFHVRLAHLSCILYVIFPTFSSSPVLHPLNYSTYLSHIIFFTCPASSIFTGSKFSSSPVLRSSISLVLHLLLIISPVLHSLLVISCTPLPHLAFTLLLHLSCTPLLRMSCTPLPHLSCLFYITNLKMSTACSMSYYVLHTVLCLLFPKQNSSVNATYVLQLLDPFAECRLTECWLNAEWLM